jgi:iron complex outermembrane receptor protein
VNQTPQNFVANAAAGRINGIELELIARPARWFTANASLGYLDAKYTSIGQGLGPTQILPITLASKFVKTPEFTATAGAEISHEFEKAGKLSLRGDVTMYSRIYEDVGNTALITEPGYVLANARLTLPGNSIQLSGFVTNLTNALYLALRQRQSGIRPGRGELWPSARMGGLGQLSLLIIRVRWHTCHRTCGGNYNYYNYAMSP